MSDLSMRNRSRDSRRAGAAALGICLIAVAAIATAQGGSSASAATFSGEISESVSISDAVDRSCFERRLDGAAGAASFTVDPGISGDDFARVDLRLDGPSGSDWDIAVFDESGETVAAGASRRSSEAATGFAGSPGELTVQVCRVAGAGTDANLSLATTPIAADAGPKSSLAIVETPTESDRQLLTTLGLDLTEHGGEDYVAVVLHGAKDRAALDKVGLDYEVEVADLVRQSARPARCRGAVRRRDVEHLEAAERREPPTATSSSTTRSSRTSRRRTPRSRARSRSTT